MMQESHARVSEGHPRLGGCPHWCVADHNAQGAPSEQWHHSEVAELSLVELHPSLEHGLHEHDVVIDVNLEGPRSSSAHYVRFGVGAERVRNFCFSIDSTRRLIAKLEEAVSLLDHTPRP